MLINLKNKYQKIKFYLIWDGQKRAEYLRKNKILKEIGKDCLFQSRIFPMDPKLLVIHNNVTIAANVTFCTHDAIRHVLNNKYKKKFPISVGCIEIMDNVFIGTGAIIMANVRIAENCIIAAGSIVTKDVLPNTIVAGNPAKEIGKFDNLVKKREEIAKNKKYFDEKNLFDLKWQEFYQERK